MNANQSSEQRFCRNGYIASAITAIALLGQPTARAGDKIELSACPQAVQKTVQAEPGKVVDIEKLTIADETVFEVDVLVDEREYELHIRPDGVLLHKVMDEDDDADQSQADDDGDDGDADEDADDEDEVDNNDDGDEEDGGDDDESDASEVRLRLVDLPKSVAKTLKRESRGGEIEEIEREIEDGRITYEAEVEFEDGDGERIYEIEINERGVLLSKSLQEDDDEEEDDEDGDEDDDEE